MSILKYNPINAKEVSDALDNKAPLNHTHDNIYYIETEINSLLATKQPVNYLNYNLYSTQTSTTGIYTTNDDMTNYKLLILQGILVGTGGSIVNMIFPVNHFQNGQNAYVLMASTAEQNYWINISWRSATSFNVNELKNMAIYRIIGVK